MEEKKHSTRTLVGACVITGFVVLVLTIVIALTVSTAQLVSLENRYNSQMDEDIGVFKTIYEMYESLPESQ